MDTYFRLTCLVVLWGGRNTASKCLQGVLVVSRPHRVCPRSQRVCFPCLHCLGSRLLCRELSEAGPGLHAAQVRALGYSSKAQARLGLHFVPFPGPSSSGAQVLGKRSHPQVGCVSYCFPCPSRSVFWVYNGCVFLGVSCVSSGELISGCNPPNKCQQFRIPRSLG